MLPPSSDHHTKPEDLYCAAQNVPYWAETVSQKLRKFGHLTLRTKITFGYGLVLCIPVVGALTGLIVGNHYHKQTIQTLKTTYQEQKLLNNLEVMILQNRPAKELTPFVKDSVAFRQASNKIIIRISHIQQSVSQLETAKTKPLVKFNPQLEEFQKNVATFSQAFNTLVHQSELLQQSKNYKQLNQLILELVNGDSFTKIIRFTQKLDGVAVEVDKDILSAEHHLRETEILRMQIIIGSIVTSFIAASLLVFFISRAIFKPLESLTNLAQEVTRDANTNLRATVVTKDEVGTLANALNQLIEWVASYAKELKLEAQQREQMELARLQAEFASAAKSSFLANMSHEIRTPMNAVLGMTSLILETPLTPEQRDFVETIRISGDALLSLINEILDLSKLESGEMSLETLDFDLSMCVEEVLDLLASQAHKKQLQIGALIHPDVPICLQGDASRLRQILMNLIANAIKFTSAGEVVVQVELKSQTSCEAIIHFAVKDTGIGISSESQQKLFMPFSQVDTSTTRKYGGTGLGLAICKQLVTLMGGEIGINSQLGIGSEFWFELPFRKQLQSTSAIKKHQLLAGLRLLVVDENATNRKIIYNQATSWGIQVDEANSATTALTAIHNTTQKGIRYDAALIDFQTTQADGISQIKANSVTTDIPLVLLISTHQRDEVERALKTGFNDYLVKPIKASRFLDTMMNIFGSLPSIEQQLCIPPVYKNTSLTKANLRILLAEDNLVNQKVAVKQLHNLGYEADVAANGEEVLQILDKIPYNLIFMDCQMPILDGLETTKEIRRRPDNFFASGRQPIVIAMTANAMKEDQQLCLDAGMDDYLSKPVVKDKLIMVLERWSKILLTTSEQSNSKQGR